METTRTAYGRWRQAYSGEVFDRAQSLASKLTAEDRAAGRPAPEFGYSMERYTDADVVVRAAKD